MILKGHQTRDNYDAENKIYRVMNPDTLSMKEYFCGRDGDFDTQEQWVINY